MSLLAQLPPMLKMSKILNLFQRGVNRTRGVIHALMKDEGTDLMPLLMFVSLYLQVVGKSLETKCRHGFQ